MFPRLLQIQTGRKAEGIYPNDGRFDNKTHELMRNNENSCVFFKSGKPRIEDQLEMLFDRWDDRDQLFPASPGRRERMQETGATSLRWVTNRRSVNACGKRDV